MPKKKRLLDEHEPNKIKRLPPKEPDTKQALDMVELLQLEGFTGEPLELALREFRIKGIDQLLAHLKESFKKKEDSDALNKYLRMFPSIEKLTEHIITEHPKSKEWFVEYNPKLRAKIHTLKR